ncbi:predicted acetyltransferase [Bacillus oleivorans]|uniref:Predicted acetyltransferase n=1 Tax=Bacillus oleivorans TaxID=1448271 RepID=A0A285CH97_9BACI|nr:GNAT family N-acetyltransferase [Bacillus oleivorans]SNX66880.1 predicted acetyltransferase [Bacillus oleivorans]
MEASNEMTILPIEEYQRSILENLMQFYFYDFSEFNGADVTETGLYGEYPYIDYYWIEKNRFPFFIYAKGKLAGFALVSRINQGDQSYYSMSEFFILRKFRRNGLGGKAANKIFEQFKGDWKVTQILTNHPAQKFWRRVIHEFTNGKYSEMVNEKTVIQLFKSR